MLARVVAFASGGGAVFYGLGGADVVTAQTAGTVVVPLWSAVCQVNVFLRTYFGASAAGYTGIGASEFFGIDTILQEQWIDDCSFKARP